MENLKGSEKFRQLLKKFNHPKQSANVQLNLDSTVRRSNRESKKPVKYCASPYVAIAKEPKRRDRSVERKNKSGELRDVSRERRDKSGERSDKFSGRKDRSRERVTDKVSKSPVVSGTKQRDLRDVFGPSSSQRGAFTRALTDGNQRSSDLTLQEPTTSQSQLNSRRVGIQSRREEYTMRHEESCIPEPERQRGFESSFRPERREPEHEIRPEKRIADTYSESGVFAMPQPVSSNQSRWRPNASRYDDYGNVRQPVVRLEDVARSPEYSYMFQSRMNPHPDGRQPTVRAQEQSIWRNSRTAQLPQNNQQRFDGGFLRPATPPGTAELVRKEESEFLATLSKFKNCPHFSTVEIIFHLNNLEDIMVRKMTKCIRSKTATQSALRMTMMETVTEDSSRSHMVQDWLKTNNSIAPPRQVDHHGVSSKRMREPTEYERVKKMRVAADEDRSYLRAREPHLKLSASLLKRTKH